MMLFIRRLFNPRVDTYIEVYRRYLYLLGRQEDRSITRDEWLEYEHIIRKGLNEKWWFDLLRDGWTVHELDNEFYAITGRRVTRHLAGFSE